MRILIILFLSVLFIRCSSEKYSEKDFYSGATLKTEREKFSEHTINHTINQSLSLPLNDSTEEMYISAFWAMELIQYRNEITSEAIKKSFNDFPNRSLSFQRAFLEVVYSLYQNEFTNEIKALIPNLNNAKLFAMCIHYLKNSTQVIELKKYTYGFESKFMKAAEDPIIKMLKYDLDNEFRKKLTIPPLIDLLKKDFGDNKIVIYSFQRLNRDFPGLLVIKNSDGKFLRDKNGEVFSVPQLARAVTDLPGYITNGNTPEGILSIQGFDVSKNIFIGPSPNLQLVLPFEVNPEIYFHNELNDTIWTEEHYKNLLPNSWREYLPIYEAFYAGKAGRNEIISHGTTINPEFYKDKTYYPFTPSLGCLTTKEIWNEETGRLKDSDQIKLMNELSSLKNNKGYFVVVNLDDKNSSVEIDEVKEILLKAEME